MWIITVLGNVVLVGLSGLVAGSTSNQLMDEAGVVLFNWSAVVLIVAIRLVGVVYLK